MAFWNHSFLCEFVSKREGDWKIEAESMCPRNANQAKARRWSQMGVRRY